MDIFEPLLKYESEFSDMDDLRRFLGHDDYTISYKLTTKVFANGVHTIFIILSLPPLYPSNEPPAVIFNCSSLTATSKQCIDDDFAEHVSIENYRTPMTGVLLDRINWISEHVMDMLNDTSDNITQIDF